MQRDSKKALSEYWRVRRPFKLSQQAWETTPDFGAPRYQCCYALTGKRHVGQEATRRPCNIRHSPHTIQGRYTQRRTSQAHYLTARGTTATKSQVDCREYLGKRRFNPTLAMTVCFGTPTEVSHLMSPMRVTTLTMFANCLPLPQHSYTPVSHQPSRF